MAIIVTCTAPVNIAVIKYWGKRDEELILPVNDSISSTLNYPETKTTIVASSNFKESRFWLNGKEETLDNERLKNCLREIKLRANPKLGDLLKWHIKINSKNDFPTAAGLASSAAGYACLVYALAKLYEVEGNISDIARRGSGSACRSIYGGWVRWHRGIHDNGSDSTARQIAPASHWPEMRLLVLVVSSARKKVSSTNAMKRTVETSQLLTYRGQQIAPQRIDLMTKAIMNRDFTAFANLTMKDSNQFHAICMDSYPPIGYLTSTSWDIIDMVHAYNELKGEVKVAYTFDAGPNAVLYSLEKDVPELLSVIDYVFPFNGKIPYADYYRVGGVTEAPSEIRSLPQDMINNLNLERRPPGCLQYMMYTALGEGPKVLTDPAEHLLEEINIGSGEKYV